MSIATNEKTGRYPWGTEVNNEPVKICSPEEVMPMTLLMPLHASLIFP